ncbi:MAG: cell division ATP-binding protein FtsE [Thermoleophilia bacterium]|nr:cell division ATP-binding protein FtsE [Thermoleophilia bacterium]
MSSDQTSNGHQPEEAHSEAKERARRRRLRRRGRTGGESSGRRSLRRDKSASFLRDGEGPMVVMEDVTKVYPGKDGGTTALDDVSLEVDSGEFVFLVGQSGSGKSTFTRLLTKELDASSGRVVVGGRDLTKLRRGRIPYLRRSIGTIFQDYKLLPGRTAYENVAYALEIIGESPRSIKRMVPEVLTLVGLGEEGGRYPDELSGGEQQRVSVARSFVNQPRLLIADEPTGNLDPDTSIGIMQLLYRINRTGTTVIMATHDRDLVDKMQMRVVELENGQIVRDQRQARYALAD